MSSLVLMEVRVPSGDGNEPDLMLTAEWFKAYAEGMQYRVTKSGYGIGDGRATRYYRTAHEAVNAVLAAARRAYRKSWE